jgi:fatty acid desaturase
MAPDAQRTACNDMSGMNTQFRTIEWPTLAVAGAIAIGFGGTIGSAHALPQPVVLALLAVLSAWYGSLQHEVIHGHPTPWRRLNHVLAVAPLGLIIPFWVYRQTHLVHHEDQNLTDPLLDPESYYVAPGTWERAGWVHRSLLKARRTLLGRIVLGPVVATYGVARYMARDRSLVGRLRIVRAILGIAVTLTAVQALGMPIWVYVLGAGYLGQSLSLVRSFAEHRAVPAGARAAVVHGGVFWRVLYLNNNYHLTHHRLPSIAWHALPAVHRASTSDADAAAGAGLYRGYGEIFRKYLVHPFCQPVSPLLMPTFAALAPTSAPAQSNSLDASADDGQAA